MCILAAVMVISLTGCCRLSEKAAITKIEKHLNEAYGGVFKVTMIEYDSEENTYTAQVTELNSYQFFTAVCTGNGSITDDYQNLPAETVLEQELNRLFAAYPYFQFRSLVIEPNGSVSYLTQLSQMAKKSESSDLDFSTLDDIDISATLVISQEDPVSMTDEVYQLYQELEQRDIPLELLIVHAYDGKEYRVEIKSSRQGDPELIRGSLHTLVLKRQIDLRLQEILARYSFLAVKDVDYSWSYSFSNDFDSVTPGITADAFLKDSSIRATVYLVLPESNPEERADEVLKLCQELNATGVDCTLKITASADAEYPMGIIFSSDYSLEVITRELSDLNK